MNNLPPSLRPKAAAEALGVSKVTLLRWERIFPSFPKPRRPTARVTLYDRDELLAWRDLHPQGNGAISRDTADPSCRPYPEGQATSALPAESGAHAQLSAASDASSSTAGDTIQWAAPEQCDTHSQEKPQ